MPIGRSFAQDCSYRAAAPNRREADLATLIRLFVALVILAILAGAAMFALATFVEPVQREIVVPIPPERLGL